jgi:hypothetical protein
MQQSTHLGKCFFGCPYVLFITRDTHRKACSFLSCTITKPLMCQECLTWLISKGKAASTEDEGSMANSQKHLGLPYYQHPPYIYLELHVYLYSILILYI